MYLYKLIIVLVAVIVAVSTTAIDPQGSHQAAETSVTHTRQKRAPLLLKKLLIGGLIAKKALLVGGVGGVIGGAAISSKLSNRQRQYPIYNYNGISPPNNPPALYDVPSPPAPVYLPARPPVYADQYPAHNSGGHVGQPVYINSAYRRPPPPPFNADCFTGSSSYHSHNSARASAGAGYT